MAKLVIELIVFSCLAFFFIGTTWLEMPNARDKKTGRKRTLYGRWRLATRQLRAQLILGVASGFVALMAVLQILGVMERV